MNAAAKNADNPASILCKFRNWQVMNVAQQVQQPGEIIRSHVIRRARTRWQFRAEGCDLSLSVGRASATAPRRPSMPAPAARSPVAWICSEWLLASWWDALAGQSCEGALEH